MSLRDGSWEKALEGGLPDCRLTGSARDRKTKRWASMLWEKVFCANCGCDGGYVTAEWSPHVFFICDSCVGVMGAPAGCVEAPEAEARGTAG